jgi:V/A-type H+-transporting ATPase subunit I
MAIIDMKKVTLIALKDDKDKTIRLLQRLGLLEITDLKTQLNQEEWQNVVDGVWSEEDLEEIDGKLGKIQLAFDFIKRYAPPKKSLFEGKRQLSSDEYEELLARKDEIFRLAEVCGELENRLTELRAEETRQKNIIQQMEPWAGLDVPLNEVRDTRDTVLMLGTVPLDRLPLFQEELAFQYPETFLQLAGESKEAAHVLMIYHKDLSEDIQDLLKDHGWATASLPQMKGTPKAIIREAQAKLEKIDEGRREIEEEAIRLSARRGDLEVLYDHISLERDRLAAAGNLLQTEKTFILEGWIPAEGEEVFRKQLEKTMDTYALFIRDPHEDEVFPTALRNPSLIEPFEMITDMYSIPDSREMDPNLFMAPFFTIFFGMMVSDAGYGVLLAIVATLLLVKIKPQGIVRKLAVIMVFGGLSTLVWGALFGGWLGLSLPPLWFNPLEEPITMLALCFSLGALHLFVGMGLQAYMNIKRGKILDALFDQGLWFVFLIGLPLLAMPALSQLGKVLSIAGAVGLILTQGRHKKGIFRKFFSGVLSLYNVTGFMSDVLSYSRLFALGLATGVIATAINTIGKMLGTNIIGMILMVVVLIGGHVFNLLINVLGAYVHSSRLQYIEFFGKFFEGGGKVFSPFRMKTKYIEVEK